jgi:hypothetical protein
MLAGFDAQIRHRQRQANQRQRQRFAHDAASEQAIEVQAEPQGAQTVRHEMDWTLGKEVGDRDRC